MASKYKRPYCKKCKLIFGKDSIGSLFKCTKCGAPLVLKTFNPNLQLLKGIIILSLGVLTYYLELPIIWIGGFLWGGQLLFSGYKQWNEIKDLDKKDSDEEEKNTPSDPYYKIFTCGFCSTKVRFKKGKGVFNSLCPTCGKVSKIRT